MFALAKLTNAFLGVLAIGSVGGIVTPIALGVANPFFKRDESKWNANLDELIKAEGDISKRLTFEKAKYSSAISWLEKLKNINFQKIIERFENLFKAESNIESQYKSAQEKFTKLIQLIKDRREATEKKLKADKTSESLGVLIKGLTTLSQGLNGWKDGFQKIVCALNNQGSSQDCNSQSASSISSSGGGAEATGGQKAQQSLEEVKSELLKTNQGISKMQGMAQKTQTKVTTMQQHQQALSASADLLLSSLSIQEVSLQREIKNISLQIEQLLEQVKQLTSSITQISKMLEALKKTISMVKDYEGKFLNNLCSLKTVKIEECNKTNQKI